MKKQNIWIFLILILFSNTLILVKFQDQKARFESYVSGTNSILTYRNIQLQQRLIFDNCPLRIDGIEERVLCLLTSRLHCNQCVDSIITTIQGFREKTPGLNISILADFDSQQDLLIFKRLNKIHFPVIKTGEMNFPILKSEIPLLFIYNPDNQTTSHIFAPDPQDPELTAEYLSIITDLLNQN